MKSSKKQVKNAVFKIAFYKIIVLIFIHNSSIYAQVPVESLYGVFQKRLGMTFGDSSSIAVNDIVADSLNNLYLIGYWTGSMSLDGNVCKPQTAYNGRFPASLSSSKTGYYGQDMFLVKYDIQGAFQWQLFLKTNKGDGILPPGQNGCKFLAVDPKKDQLAFSTVYGSWANVASPESVDTAHRIIYGNGVSDTIPYTTPIYGNNVGYNGIGKVKVSTGEKVAFQKINNPDRVFIQANAVADNVDSIYNLKTQMFPIPNLNSIPSPTTYLRNYLVKYNPNTLDSISNTYVSDNPPISITPVNSYTNPNSNYLYYISYSRRNYMGIEGTAANVLVRANKHTPSYNGNDTTILTYSTAGGVSSIIGQISPGDDSILCVTNELNSNNTSAYHLGVNFMGNNGQILSSGNYTTIKGNKWTPTPNWMIFFENPNKDSVTLPSVLYNDATGHIIAVGSFKGTINFDSSIVFREGIQNTHISNPLFRLTSKGGFDIFIAIYDKIDGHCLKVYTFGGVGNDQPIAAYLKSGYINLISNIGSNHIVLDPSNKLSSLNITGNAIIYSRFSLDSLTPLTPPQFGSFSDANNSRSTLGLANHDTIPCLQLGNINSAISYTSSLNYFADKNPYNPNYDGIKILFTSKDNNAIDSQVVYAQNNKNSVAYLRGWIDYNANGIFETEETSFINNTATLSSATKTNPNTGLLPYKLYFKNLCPTNNSYNPGSIFMRIRLCSDYIDSLAATGTLSDGEVEDYFIPRNTVAGSQPNIAISATSLSTQYQRIGNGDTMKPAVFTYSGIVNSLITQGLDQNIQVILDTVTKTITVRSKLDATGNPLPVTASCNYTIIVADTNSRPAGQANYFCSVNSINGTITISYLRGLSLKVNPDTVISNHSVSGILSLNTAITYDLLVGISAAGTAKVGIDYETPPTTLTIPAGSRSIPFTINTLAGNVIGKLSEVQLTASTPFDVYYNADTSFSIKQTPTPTQTVFSIFADSTAIQEGSSTKFKVSLPKGISTQNPIHIYLVKPRGNPVYRAFDTLDYKTNTSIDSVTIPALDSNVSFTLTALNDTIIELPEVANIQLASIPAPSSQYHFTNANPDSATLTIRDITIMNPANRVIRLTVNPNILIGCNIATITASLPPHITSSVHIPVYVDTFGSTAISTLHYVPFTQPITIAPNTTMESTFLYGGNDTKDRVILQMKPFASPIYPTYPDFEYQKFQLPILPFTEPIITIAKEYNDTTDYLPCKKSMLSFKITNPNPLMLGQYQWCINNVPIDNAHDLTFNTNVLKPNDIVSCRFIYDFPCNGLLYTNSNPLPIYIDSTCTILSEEYSNSKLRIFSNPISRSHPLIRYSFLSIQDYLRVEFMLVDNSGRAISANSISGDVTKNYYGIFDGSVLVGGTYILICIAQKIDGSRDVYSKNIIIQ